MSRGLADEPVVLASVAAEMGLAYRETLEGVRCPETFTEAVAIGFARRHRVVGVGTDDDGTMTLATAWPFSRAGGRSRQGGQAGEREQGGQEGCDGWPGGRVIANVAKVLGCAVRVVVSPPEAVLGLIDRAYEGRDTRVEQQVAALGENESIESLTQMAAGEDLLDSTSKAPVVRLINAALLEAVKQRASDMHIQPFADRVQIRFRIDGILYDRYRVPRAWAEPVCSRIKVMGQMNIAEKRLAQDGRCTVFVGGKEIDLRIASLPTAHGERIVLRLLDLSARLYRLSELGMSGHDLPTFRRLLGFSHGIVLVTGPTGSGKSTTLYAGLQELDSGEKNIITIEDPIEYQLPGISQTQVATKKGVTFATALRHVLRQDPDVIMVGEIRDEETARMAVQSALTGHLVFSTLHTNDAPSAVARLLELGVEPYLVASSVVAVLAQRLVRRICPQCRTQLPVDPAVLDKLGLPAGALRPTHLYEGTGCPCCFGTGYQSRLGIFELLAVDETIRQLIMAREKASTIKAAAMAGGMRTLRQDGAIKVAEGITSGEEVLRVTQLDTF